MVRGLNKVILLGNLGKDPEIRYSASGTTVCTFRIATTDTWKDKQSGQKKERTEWHTIIVFNKLASIVQQYLKKGSRVYIEGRLQIRKWQERYITEIIASEVQLIDFKVGSKVKVVSKVGKKVGSKVKVVSKVGKKVGSKVGKKVVSKNIEYDKFDDEIPF